ncbi:tetratricopeptide repeat protein [Cognatiyoonia sp. IB215446]|uniref:tetratricopeptide repeat protein n=1 Tax=Cognatiyoonia sp. IB215446 TaxID=3097355 RepID=UPI002A0C02A1|nr:tetratricopeptide repeat protein [Cognatiyoonia sp. IB215446]MDX8349217.1 tetratricopeptide repeat protein [Cognatiyoonia sp. IB215446]
MPMLHYATRRTLRRGLLCVALCALVACKTSEEKADEFYQSGLTLLEAGDLDRAAIEFLNVFQHDGFHQDARRQLADIRMAQGQVGAAYGQYLRLIEQYPDTPDVRLILARTAIDINNWDEVRRHGDAAFQLVPDNPIAQALQTALTYRDATFANDLAAQAAAATRAHDLLAADRMNEVARRVVIDDLLRSDTPMDAMPEIDRALQLDPESYAYHTIRLRLLMQVGDISGIRAQLERMVALYPEDDDLTNTLVSWHLSQEDFDEAEIYLRELAGDIAGPVEGHIAVVQLIQGAHGPSAAKVELDRLAAANAGTPNADIYRSLAAVIRFDEGAQEDAIATFADILESAPAVDQTRRIRNTYARLLIAQGDIAGARDQVDTILSEDQSNVDALKLRAGWAIADDRADQAILDLRMALGQQPRDAEILTLMADAHEREGSLALAGERLALAFDISGAAPDTALRYASFLMREGRSAAARNVLTDARAANPGDIPVMTALARILLTKGAWVEAQSIANTLRSIETPSAQEAATSLQAALLLGQNRVDDSLAFLQGEIDQGNADITAITQVVQIHLRSGNVDSARVYLDQALTTHPDDRTLLMLDASLHAMAGAFDRAEDLFRDMIAATPTAEAPVLRLYNLLVATDQPDAASALIDEALKDQPDSLNLRWIRAGALEAQGDIDGAIALYEEMYAVNSSAVTIANNLASLIATHKNDAESIARAAAIAKRLRELDLPPFQDTYGWIAYRQNKFDEALTYLKPAAEGLPDDPLVQYHLGMTYAALGDHEKAIEQLGNALALAGSSPLPQFDEARAKLQELSQ